jgi:hypothetical protein
VIAVLVGLARWRWLLPLSWVLAIWWALITDPNLIQGRFLNAAVQGVQVVMFLAPATAVAGVLAGATMRRNNRRTLTGSRPLFALVIGVSAVHTFIAVTALTLSSVMIGLSAHALGTDGWQVIGLAGLTAAGASTVGQALGRGLPEVVAAPVALLGSYVVLAFPRTFSEPLWLRHLVFVDSCCNSPDQVSPRVLTAIALMSSATVAAGLLTAFRGRRLAPGLVAGAVVLAIAWNLGTSLVRDLGWSPATARTGEIECAPAGDGQVCVWPENAAALPDLAAVWGALRQTAREHGLDLTASVTERADGPVAYGDGLISLTPQTAAAAFPEVLAAGGLPAIDPCVVGGTMDSRIDNAWLTLARWWISTSGYTHSDNLIEPPYDYLDVPAGQLDGRLQTLIDSIRACDAGNLP